MSFNYIKYHDYIYSTTGSTTSGNAAVESSQAGWGFEPHNPGYDPGTLSTRLSLPRMLGTSPDPAICPLVDPDRKVGGAN